MADNTAFQANFKLADGTLINIYADDAAKFEAQLAQVQDLATLIHSVSGSLGSAPQGGVGYIKKQFPGATVVKPAITQINPLDDRVNPPIPSGNTCKHGAMVFKEGVSSKGPWKGWMCPSPKGALDKCETIWIR